MAEAFAGLAAVGVASNILQVIDFSFRVAKQTARLINSSEDTLRENIEVEQLTRDYKLISEQIWRSDDGQTEQAVPEDVSLVLSKKCRNEARELLQLLDDLKVQSNLNAGRRVLQGGRKVARALKLRKKISARLQHLEKLNGQLATSLLCKLKSSQNTQFEDIVSRIEHSQRSIISSILAAKSELLRKLDPIADSIIDSLRFPEIGLRRSAILDAHAKTFEWIFSDTSSPFRAWLDTGQGIFWISGQAGSGKSTLMKYLCSHPITRQALQGTDLIEYYFWYLGTPLQKSTEGLLRSILYQLFRYHPEIVSIAVPHRWNAAPSFHREPDLWTYEELCHALEIVASKASMGAKLCFFIDGLDEYSGDHQDLVDLLRKLDEHPGLKICVSSRPWNVFDNAFGRSSMLLRLKELTKCDMEIYVSEKLQDLQNTAQGQDLIFEIVRKAQGVFLWVFLVVRSLRRGLVEGDDTNTMRQRLAEFPSDLEEYFELILSRIDAVYRTQTSQALSLAVMLADNEESEGPTGLETFLSYRHIANNSTNDADFGVNSEIRKMTPADFDETARQTKKFVNARCKDLLHLVESSGVDTGSLYRYKVEFLHRTVYDFLKVDRIAHMLAAALPVHFSTPNFKYNLVLANLKFVPHDSWYLYTTISTHMPIISRALLELREDSRLKCAFEKLAIGFVS